MENIVVCIKETGELLVKGRFKTLKEAEASMKDAGYDYGFADVTHVAEASRKWEKYKKENF